MDQSNIRSPQTDEEFARYYELRWQVLREHLGEPRGSERDELEGSADHVAIWSGDGEALAVGRLHLNSPSEAQIRYMAVTATAQGQGLGRQIVERLEEIACQRGATSIVLNSRDSAAGFYERLGYEVVGPGPLLFGRIPHFRMRKGV